MHGFDYDACVYDGEVYCNECLPDGIGENDEDIMPIFADSEHDSYPVCGNCLAIHDYVNLTSYGREQEILRKNEESAYFDRFDILDAYYMYASNYHRGQNSKEYRIFGRLDNLRYSPGLGASSNRPSRLSENAQIIYARLVAGDSKVRG